MTAHIAVYTIINTAVLYLLSSPLPSDGRRLVVEAYKGVPQGLEALFLTGATSSCYNTIGKTYPAWDVRKESP